MKLTLAFLIIFQFKSFAFGNPLIDDWYGVKFEGVPKFVVTSASLNECRTKLTTYKDTFEKAGFTILQVTECEQIEESNSSGTRLKKGVISFINP